MTDASEDVIRRNWEYRVESLQAIEKQQFQMVYFGKFSYHDTEEMSVEERRRIYELLYEQKKTEKEEYEKALREAKAKQSKGSRKARR